MECSSRVELKMGSQIWPDQTSAAPGICHRPFESYLKPRISKPLIAEVISSTFQVNLQKRT